MLDEFVRAAGKRLRSSVFDAYLDELCSFLVDSGYAVPTIRHKLWVLSDLARWMTREHLAVVDLDEERVGEYLEVRQLRGRSCRGFRSTALQLIEQLRRAGVVRAPQSVRDDSPPAVLLRRYEDYLRQERALADSTIYAYLPFARDLIGERLSEGTLRPDSLGADDIREFLLARARRMTPKRAQAMCTALRSFLRFLFLRGETGSDLALAVPTVRRWRLSSVPCHLSDGDVERLLRACQCSSATGRRDHAILLLLARLGMRGGPCPGARRP